MYYQNNKILTKTVIVRFVCGKAKSSTNYNNEDILNEDWRGQIQSRPKTSASTVNDVKPNFANDVKPNVANDVKPNVANFQSNCISILQIVILHFLGYFDLISQKTNSERN